MKGINKEDKDIRQLFEEFNPGLTPSADFVNKTMNKLEGYSMVKARFDHRSRYYTQRCFISLAIGFIAGAILTLLFPYVQYIVSNFLLSASDSLHTAADTFRNSKNSPLIFGNQSLSIETYVGGGYISIITWILISLATLGATFSGFRLSGSLLKNHTS